MSGQSVGSYDFDKMGTYALTKDSSNGRPVYHQVLPDALWSPVTDLIVSVQTNAMKGKQQTLMEAAATPLVWPTGSWRWRPPTRP